MSYCPSNFPKNPSHGTIFEPKPGVFYIYDVPTKTWVRTDGGSPQRATPVSAGLMAYQDLYKLNRLIVPPPQTTLRAENCLGVLEGGIIEFKVGDQFLSIDGTAKLMNEAAGIGSADAQVVERKLHQHTNSFDFRVDTDTFYEYMESTNRFRVITVAGVQGPPGDTGLPGQDNLPHGPKGPTGDAGSNAPFDVDLSVDPIALEKKSSSTKAIVSMGIENVSEDENYLVAYRATIGNPNACPADIRLTSELSSTWAVCTAPTVVSEQSSSDECFVCTGSLYYIDLAFIAGSIRNEFDREVQTLKSGMESIVSFWITIMAGVFDEQKAAICCALEHCRSQSRNVETRQYIEQSRIQAAQSDHSIIIEGDPDEDTKAVTIMESSCLPDGFGTDNIHGVPNNQDPIGGSACVPWIMYDEDGKPIKYDSCPAGFTPRDIYLAYTKTGDANAAIASQRVADKAIAEVLALPLRQPKAQAAPEVKAVKLERLEPIKAVEVPPAPSELELVIGPEQRTAAGDLAKGFYTVSVSGLVEVDGQFTAGCSIYYESGGPQVRRVPDILSSNKDELEKAYKTLAVHIDHDGGQVSVAMSAPEYATGSLTLSFLSGKKAKVKEDKVLQSLKRPVEVVQEEDNSRVLAGYCEITSDYLRWYEKQWKLKKGSSVVLDLAGQTFVIMYHSESKIACAPTAIAWPTLDGDSFMPSAGKVMFARLRKLETKALDLIKSGKYSAKVGNLSDIETIYFPTL